MTTIFKVPTGTVTISKYVLRAPSGTPIMIRNDDTFVSINQYGNVLTSGMIRKLTPKSAVPIFDKPCPDGAIRTIVNGVTIQHPDKPSHSASAAVIATIRTIVTSGAIE